MAGVLAPQENPALLNPLWARQIQRWRAANERPPGIDDALRGMAAGVQRWPAQVKDDLEQLGQWLAQKKLGEQNISNVLNPEYRAMNMPTVRGNVGPSPSKQFEFGRGAAELLNPAYLMPTGAEGPALGIFAGVKGASPAKLKLLDAAGGAKDLRSQGASREEILQKTGWFEGVDGKWRFEIPDNAAKLSDKPLPSSDVIIFGENHGKAEHWKVGGVLDHPQLFDAYPDLARIDSSFKKSDGTRAEYRPGSDWISYSEDYAKRPAYSPEQAAKVDAAWQKVRDLSNNPDYARLDKALMDTVDDSKAWAKHWEEFSAKGYQKTHDEAVRAASKAQEDSIGNRLADTEGVTLHELQHAIQSREGFARGGNTGEMKQMQDWGNARVNFLNTELSRIAKELDYARSFAAKGFPDQSDRIAGLEAEYAAYMKDKLHIVESGQLQKDPYDLYRNLAGEAEARTVQKRMALTPEQRAARPPWLDYDVPPEQMRILQPDETAIGALTRSSGSTALAPKAAHKKP